MRLAGRLFVGSSLLLTATVVGLIIAADLQLRRHLEDEIAAGLEREARLVMALVPADSATWSDSARRLGALIGRRVTLIDPSGRVRGDTEFDPASLGELENHATRPEVLQARGSGVGRDQRLSASTNERRLYVAVRGGPPGLAIVRVSTTLAAADAEVYAVERGVALAGLVALLAAALLTWLLSGAVARPLEQLAHAAQAIASGRPPVFPDSRVPEIAEHVIALHTMHEQLEQRFRDLRREREETQTLIETMADGVLAADATGRVATLNGAARRLLGYGPSDVPPPLPELFHDKEARSLVRDVLAGTAVEPRELGVGGHALLVTGRALPNGGTLLVFRDVTEIRQLDAIRRDFVANVSHELKTPLTSIVGYAETLAAEAGAATQAGQFVETILSNARRMQRLVDDLLDLSRIESGHWQPTPRVVELAPLVQDAWAAFAARAQEGGVEFALDLAAPAAIADPDALRQILTNLLDNALRYTPAGGRIVVSSEPAPDGVTLAVADTGTGIAPTHLPRIFERFYRADAGRSRTQGGTGLGLAIVKHLVEVHGGRVWAESALGRGMTVRMLFPSDNTLV